VKSVYLDIDHSKYELDWKYGAKCETVLEKMLPIHKVEFIRNSGARLSDGDLYRVTDTEDNILLLMIKYCFPIVDSDTVDHFLSLSSYEQQRFKNKLAAGNVPA
jgi:hypothetical protein